MPARKMRKRPEGKRVVACETMEEEEQWSETWERYHGKCGETFREKTTVWWWVKRKVMDKTEREGVCIVKRGGDRKRKDGGEQLCSSWHLHRQHLGKPSITEVRLIDFSPLFNQHCTGRPSLSLECTLMLTQLPIFYFFLFYTSGPNCDCQINCPRAASNQQIRWENENMFLS